MAGVAVVTDSTADIDGDVADERGLRVVPMTVAFGEDELTAGMDIDISEFYERLRTARTLPTTSQPRPAWFEEAYLDAADDEADAVVSIHLSGELSGTVQLARTMAKEATLPVTVVDSRQVSGSLALSVLAAQRVAAAGGGAADVAEVAQRVAERARIFFVVDTLEYLRRGGRLRATQAFIGSALRVKPLLTIKDGKVEPLERTRTWTRAVDRLGELVEEAAGDAAVDVVVSHGLAPARAAEAWARIEDTVQLRERLETVIGPVVGTHAGPGAVGIAVVPAELG